jgi:hypothetical protein
MYTCFSLSQIAVLVSFDFRDYNANVTYVLRAYKNVHMYTFISYINKKLN